ncbi:MAG TPA: VanW family protein [Patescibacteria group bacterium]|nr:VanW family protein [Patescibacteria group bacterium]
MLKKIIEAGELAGSKIITKWLLGVAVFLIVAIVFGGAVVIYNYYYNGRVYPAVRFDELDLGGKTKEQARSLIQAKIDQLLEKGVAFNYNEQREIIKPIIYGSDSEGLAYELWNYDLDKMVDNIYAVGRGDGGWLERIEGLFGRVRVEPEYRIKEKEVGEILKEKFGQLEEPGEEAELVFAAEGPIVSEEKIGRVFDYEQALAGLKENIFKLDNREINLVMVNDLPQVTKEKVENLLTLVEPAVDLAPITLKFKEEAEGKILTDKKWTIKKSEWQAWLKAKDNGQGEAYIGIDETKASERLKEIAEGIDQPAKDARFTMQDGRVVEFQSSQDGRVVNIEETIQTIEIKVLREKNSEVDLMMTIDKSQLTNEGVNDLGIKELVGQGESNFAGSPKNRIHNIGVGAAALNGLLIKPGEEFSINKALGTIDGSTGYKQEMVIKGDRTIPEYGGGLCQIGTTLFRLAINTGLPITERRNHSYRVSYYEPAGTDATIYGPWPDLKFINDTGNYLLLQTRVEGTKAYFDFWGTRDGREVATTTPTIYNIVSAGETKIIETEDLKPGEKKCTERAHNGADAYFKRTIIWPEGFSKEKVEETFRSHYVPWQAVCLIGKVATSTSEVIGE